MDIAVFWWVERLDAENIIGISIPALRQSEEKMSDRQDREVPKCHPMPQGSRRGQRANANGRSWAPPAGFTYSLLGHGSGECQRGYESAGGTRRDGQETWAGQFCQIQARKI
jgi:hypothetical protein